MPAAKPSAVILLPEKRRFSEQAFSAAFKSSAQKMFVTGTVASGEAEQLKRHFQLIPNGWPLAALCRQAECGDALDSQWLRADPVYMQAEMRGARIMAWDNLALSSDEQAQMLAALRPVFGDLGFEFSASRHGYFYVRALHGSPLPAFTAAPDLLGCDLAEHMPAERKWLALLNECQVILHNHPLNVERARIGQAPINGLWFWAQGDLPAAIQHNFLEIHSDKNDIKALAGFSKQHLLNATSKKRLIDLRSVRDWREVEAAFNANGECLLDFADGVQWQWKPAYRWCFWRRKELGFS